MNEERAKILLRSADRAAGPPVYGRVTSVAIRRRLARRRVIALGVPIAAAAMLILGVATTYLATRPGTPVPVPPTQDNRIASLQDQVQQLQAQSEATLRLVQQVIEQQRQQERLRALQAELASITDPAERMQQQADKTAFTLVYQADRMYRELNQTESAVEAYEQVIRLFPDNQWADVARSRLSEIKPLRINNAEMEGETLCEPQRKSSSV